MDLLNLCLTSTYFQYNGKHQKQLHAMGSPVSAVVAELYVEERALATCRQTIPFCLRYVDDAPLPPFTNTKLTIFTTT